MKDLLVNTGTLACSLIDNDLMSQCDYLELQREPRAKQGRQKC